jgi:probable O-glycosylation ligase (exosortase A-associated)
MRILLVCILYVLGTGLALRATVYASCLFVWNDIFRPFAFARNEEAFPAAWYVFAVLTGSYFLRLFQGKLIPNFGGYFLHLSILILWVGITVIVSPFREDALIEYIRYLKYLLPLLLIYSSLQSTREVKMFAAILAASVGVWACQAGVICLIRGPTIDMGIPGGQMGERNDFTAAMVACIPVFVYFMFSYDWRFKLPVKLLAAVAIALSLVAIVLSLSRGSSLGLLASLLAYLAFVSKRKFRDGIIAAILLVIGFFLTPASWFDRMHTIKVGTEQSEASAMERMEAMTGAFHATLDRPIAGWGPDGWLHVVGQYTSMTANPHCIYLKLSSETGLVGLLLMLWIVFYTYRQLQKVVALASRYRDKDAGRLAMAMATGIFGYLAALTFLNAPFHEYLWSWISLANAYAVIYPRELNARLRRLKSAG